MVLVIGGSFQGKYQVALELCGKNLVAEDTETIKVMDGIYDRGKLAHMDETKEKIHIWNHFHEYVREMIAGGMSREDILKQVEKIYKYNPDLIIICDEVGSGIVPMEKEERIYREEVGRISCVLAQKASRVIRVVCGMGMEIKHES